MLRGPMRTSHWDKLKRALLQNGFCTNLSDFEAKRCSPKNVPEKRNVFHRVLLRGLSCRTDSARIFPISRQKVAHRKTHRRTHRKTECFHRIFPPNFSPNFRCVCVLFCSKNSKCHRKTASKKFSQKIHRGTQQNPECRCGRGGSLSTCPFEKQELSRNKWKCIQLAVLHVSAFQDKLHLLVPALSST